MKRCKNIGFSRLSGVSTTRPCTNRKTAVIRVIRLSLIETIPENRKTGMADIQNQNPFPTVETAAAPGGAGARYADGWGIHSHNQPTTENAP